MNTTFLRVCGTAAVIALSAGLLGACGDTAAVSTGAAVATAGEGSTTAASSAPTAGPEPLTDGTLRGMEEGGTTAQIVDAEKQSPKVSREDATATAQKVFSGFVQDKQPAEASLALVTNKYYGDATNPKDLANSEVKLLIQNRLCWVIVFHDVPQPQSGPVETRGDEAVLEVDTSGQRPGVALAPLFVLVDANTGEYIRAESL